MIIGACVVRSCERSYFHRERRGISVRLRAQIAAHDRNVMDSGIFWRSVVVSANGQSTSKYTIAPPRRAHRALLTSITAALLAFGGEGAARSENNARAEEKQPLLSMTVAVAAVNDANG